MPGIAALCVAYVLSQFFRSFLAVLVPYLSRDLSMSASEMAYASGAWFVAFALMQFPIGAWLDRYGPRRTAAWLHGLAAGGGAALFALAQSPLQVIVAMGLVGVGCAPVLMATFFLFARNYSAAGFATLGSTFIAAGSLGNIAGSAPMAWAVEQFGWRPSMWFLCAVTLVTALAVLVLVHDPKQTHHDHPPGGYLDLVRIRKLWPIFPMVFLGYGVAAGIRGLWVGPYLQDVHHLGTAEIGQATLMMAIALSLGSLFYGPLDRLFNSRKWVVLLGNLVVLAAVGAIALRPEMAVWQATVLFVAIGLFGASYAVQMAHGKAYVPAHLTGRGVTLLNFFSIGGVGVMQLLTGRTFDAIAATSGPLDVYAGLFGLYAVALAVVLAIYLLAQDAKPRAVGVTETG